jgi:YVTN family beta-propeller protein
VGLAPRGIRVTSDGSKAYVTNNTGNSLSVINTSTDSVDATVTGFAGPVDIAFAPFLTAVPTLSQWAMIALGLLLGGFALSMLGHRRSMRV